MALGSNRNEYQDNFLGVKAADCAAVTKSGNLNFLEPSGPVQACNGTALPLYIYIYIYILFQRKYLQ